MKVLIGFWKSKKVTIMVIPSAARPASQINFRQYSFTIVSLIVLLLFVGLCTMALFSILHFQSEKKMTNQKYVQQELAFNEQLIQKEKRLGDLKVIVNELSLQATEFKSKLNTLNTIHNDIQLMEKSTRQTLQLPENKTHFPATHQGGQYYPLPNNGIDQLALSTKIDMVNLTQSIDKLLIEMSEKENILKVTFEKHDKLPSIWPTTDRKVTSGFGYRKDPLTKQSSHHSGIDIQGIESESILATASGKVAQVGYDSLHGNFIRIDHGNSIKTAYLHLNKVIVTTGDFVKKGQQIGMMGSTGRSTGTHLHYEIHLNHKAVDPHPYLKDEIQY